MPTVARSFSLIAAFLTSALLCNAGPITYSVDLNTSGGFGSVVGTIATDGNIGVLAASDIEDWNLVLTFPQVPPDIGDLEGPFSGNNSGLTVIGSGLTATTTGLFFNFGATNTLFDFLITGGTYGYAPTSFLGCVGEPPCTILPNGNEIYWFAKMTTLMGSIGTVYGPNTGDVQIASASASALPEPVSLALVLLGLALIALVRRAGFLHK